MGDDDLQLDSKDLLDIFGADDPAAASEDLGKSIEDLFFSDDEEGAGSFSLEGVAEAPALPVEAPAPPAAPEPELAEPDRKGMTEEEWRTSSEYADFKKQVIERHLKKKADEELAKKAAAEQAIQDEIRLKEEDAAKAAEKTAEK